MNSKQINWHPISRDDALALCEDIRQENRGKWYKPLFWRCWGCMKLAAGNPDTMSFGGMPGNRGCKLINERYDRQFEKIR